MVAGAACTLFHLGNIGYFYGILSNFGSWLTRESWLVGLFACLCIVSSVLSFRGQQAGGGKALIAISVIGLCAGCLLLFCMSMAYMTAHAIPSWNDMGVLITNIAEMLVLGSALALVLTSLGMHGEKEAALRHALSTTAVASSAVALVAFVCYFVSLTLLPDTSVVMSESNMGLGVAKVILLAAALLAAIALRKKADAINMSLPLVATFVIAVLASDVLSRMLHFALATHIPLVF